jgi:hypothetical protein
MMNTPSTLGHVKAKIREMMAEISKSVADAEIVVSGGNYFAINLCQENGGYLLGRIEPQMPPLILTSVIPEAEHEKTLADLERHSRPFRGDSLDGFHDYLQAMARLENAKISRQYRMAPLPRAIRVSLLAYTDPTEGKSHILPPSAKEALTAG